MLSENRENNEIPSFHIPEQGENEALENIEDARGLFDFANPEFLGLPMSEVLPSFMKNDEVFLSCKQRLSMLLRAIIPAAHLSDHEYQEMIEKIFDFMKMYAYQNKKNISMEDVRTLVLMFSRSFSKDHIRKIGSVIQECYARIIFDTQNYVERELFYFSANNPSFFPLKIPTKNHEFGQGGYDEHGEWSYGPQHLQLIPSGNAVFSQKILHPSCMMEFSLMNVSDKTGYSLRLYELYKEFSFNNDGHISAFSKEKIESALMEYFISKMGTKKKWKTYTSDSMIHNRIDIVQKDGKTVMFSVVAIMGISENDMYGIKIDVHNSAKNKIGEITTKTNQKSFYSHAIKKTAQFLSEYVASELCMYVFCASKNMKITHPAIVSPNGTPWMASRLSGQLAYFPYGSTGQLASPAPMLLPIHKQSSSNNPISRSLQQSNEEKSLSSNFDVLTPWETFLIDSTVDVISSLKYRVSYNNNQYYVEIEKHPQGKGFIACLYNDIAELIEETMVLSQEKDRSFFAGQVCLATALRIENTPSYKDLGWTTRSNIILTNHGRKYESIPSLDVHSEGTELRLSVPSDPLSYSINPSSLIMRKFGSQNNLHGNLTNCLKIFEYKERLVDPEKDIKISTYKDLYETCNAYFSGNIMTDFVKLSFFKDKHLNVNAILSGLYSAFGNIDFGIIPPLNNMDAEIYTNKSFPFITVDRQNFNSRYTVTLVSEYLPDRKFSDSIEEKNDLQRLYQFEITCFGEEGNPLFLYAPDIQTEGGIQPRYASLEHIICGYLPDFIIWANTIGFDSHRLIRISSSFHAKSFEKTRFMPSNKGKSGNTPFFPDFTMMTEQYETVRIWLARKFPSLIGMKHGFSSGDMDVFQHSLHAAKLVDQKGSTGFSIGRDIKDARQVRMLRIAALLHDIGKSSPDDGGVGGFSSDHPSVSAALSIPLIRKFKFRREDQETIVRLIRHHDVIAKAQEGKYGSIDEAAAHVAKLCQTKNFADLLYCLHRCDEESRNSSFFIEKNPVSTISGATQSTAKEFIEIVKNHLVFSKFSKTAIYEDAKNTMRRLATRKDVPLSDRSTMPAEYVQKVNNFLDISTFFPEEKRMLSFNPEYYEKMKHVAKNIKENPDLSFASSLGMSYEGATGSLFRCFYWTNKKTAQKIFTEGLRNYRGVDGRSVHCFVNSPSGNDGMLGNFFGIFGKNSNVLDHKILVVFDYHAGKCINYADMDTLRESWMKWKIAKVGQQLFSLGFNENEDMDNASIALSLGYSTIVEDEQIIACIDPARVALIGAYEIQGKNHNIGMPHMETSYQDHYGSNPISIEMKMPNGIEDSWTSPKIDSSEIFINNSHTHYNNGNPWNGIPREMKNIEKITIE